MALRRAHGRQMWQSCCSRWGSFISATPYGSARCCPAPDGPARVLDALDAPDAERLGVIRPWQVPTVLQTLFDQRSGAQPAAMANLKLWQSLGIGLMFGLAQLSNLRLSAALLLGLLVLSSAALLVAHIAIVDFDTGERRRRRDSGMQ